MTSCFVYKVIGLTFHDRINTQLIHRFELAQVVARRITKPQRFFLVQISLAALFLFSFFFREMGVGSDFIILFMSFFFFLLFFYYFIFYFLSL